MRSPASRLLAEGDDLVATLWLFAFRLSHQILHQASSPEVLRHPWLLIA